MARMTAANTSRRSKGSRGASSTASSTASNTACMRVQKGLHAHPPPALGKTLGTSHAPTRPCFPLPHLPRGTHHAGSPGRHAWTRPHPPLTLPRAHTSTPPHPHTTTQARLTDMRARMDAAAHDAAEADAAVVAVQRVFQERTAAAEGACVLSVGVRCCLRVRVCVCLRVSVPLLPRSPPSPSSSYPCCRCHNRRGARVCRGRWPPSPGVPVNAAGRSRAGRARRWGASCWQW